MFDFVTPSLLWGTAAVAAPILIHLLMRQRPKPTPWAAMRWLQAAIEVAQRRYKLTNLLLLLLRCLILMLLAWALARPSLAGVGSGGDLVLVVDTTASMGPRGDGSGALRRAVRELEEQGLDHRRVHLLAVGESVRRFSGSIADTLTQLKQLEASPHPGGIDRLADDELADQLLAVCQEESDVVLISDFRQDDGSAITALLEGRVHSCVRWQVTGGGTGNALITGIAEQSDLVPGLPGEVILALQGQVEQVELAIDGGQALPQELTRDGDLARLGLPPLTAGEHLLTLDLLDSGLRYDDHLELPLLVRDSVPVLLVEDERDLFGAALLADTYRLDTRIETPGSLLQRPLPEEGLVALRQPLATGGDQLRRWAEAGGVLWAPREVFGASPGLAPLVDELGGDRTTSGGELTTGDRSIDSSLGHLRFEQLPDLRLPPQARVLVRAGDTPFIVALPLGDGLLVVEAVAAESFDGLAQYGGWPLWVRQTARQLTAELRQPTVIEAGRPAPTAWRLDRHGREERFAAGETVLLEPGLWRRNDDRRPVVVLANRDEGRLAAPPLAGVVDNAADALPAEPGRNWGPWLLAAMFLVLLSETAFAAWAGRTYAA